MTTELIKKEDTNVLSKTNFAHSWQIAQVFAASDFVPESYRGKPENCLIALDMSERMNLSPAMVMQKTYIIHGKPGIEAKLAIALANNSGKLKSPITYAFKGEGMQRECTASAVLKGGENISFTVSMKLAKDEGWLDKKDKRGNFISKWRTLPDLMLTYRSGSFLIGTNLPEVILGMSTAEELTDMQKIEKATDITADAKVFDLKAEIEKKNQLKKTEEKPERKFEQAKPVFENSTSKLTLAPEPKPEPEPEPEEAEQISPEHDEFIILKHNVYNKLLKLQSPNRQFLIPIWTQKMDKESAAEISAFERLIDSFTQFDSVDSALTEFNEELKIIMEGE